MRTAVVLIPMVFSTFCLMCAGLLAMVIKGETSTYWPWFLIGAFAFAVLSVAVHFEIDSRANPKPKPFMGRD